MRSLEKVQSVCHEMAGDFAVDYVLILLEFICVWCGGG
jgi:hypothetical protein